MNNLENHGRQLAFAYVWGTVLGLTFVLLPLRAFRSPISFLLSNIGLGGCLAIVVAGSLSAVVAFVLGGIAARKVVQGGSEIVQPGVVLALIVYVIGCAAYFLAYHYAYRISPKFAPANLSTSAVLLMTCLGVPIGSVVAVWLGVKFCTDIRKRQISETGSL